MNKNTLTIKEQQKLSQFLTTSNLKELSSEDLSKRMGTSSKLAQARGGIPLPV